VYWLEKLELDSALLNSWLLDLVLIAGERASCIAISNSARVAAPAWAESGRADDVVVVTAAADIEVKDEDDEVRPRYRKLPDCFFLLLW
jgi:hypothetical protein